MDKNLVNFIAGLKAAEHIWSASHDIDNLRALITEYEKDLIHTAALVPNAEVR